MYIGIDFGRTKLECCHIADKVDYYKEPSIYQSKKLFIKQILSKIHKDCEGVGISIPGPFDYKNNMILNPDKMRAIWNFRIGKYIYKKTGLLPIFMSGTNSFLYAELKNPLFKNKTVLALTLGSGLGISAAINSRILKENSSIGNNPIENKNIEYYTSGKGISRMYQEKTGELKSTKEIATIALSKSSNGKVAANCFNNFGKGLARAIIPHLNFLKPDYLVYSGGIVNSESLFKHVLIKEINKHYRKKIILRQASSKPSLGLALLARDRFYLR